MNSRTTAFLGVAQVLLLLAYLPMSMYLWVFAYNHVPPGLFGVLPSRLAIALLPQLITLSPILYGALRARGPAGPIGLLVVAWCLVATTCWVIVAPLYNDLLVPPEPFAPLGWPELLASAAAKAPEIGVPSLTASAATGFLFLRFSAGTRRAKAGFLLAPVAATLVGWLTAEALFAWQVPNAAQTQFGAGYCLTGMGSATQSLRYSVGLSGYRHAETRDKDSSYHWSFKAKKFVPEDHWGTSGYVWQRTCPAGSHIAKDARRY